MKNLTRAFSAISAAAILAVGLPAVTAPASQAAPPAQMDRSAQTDHSVSRQAIQPRTLAAPTNVQVQVTPTGLDVSWNSVTGAVSYVVYVGKKDVQGPLAPTLVTGSVVPKAKLKWSLLPSGDAYRVHVAAQSRHDANGAYAGRMTAAANISYDGPKLNSKQLKYLRETNNCVKSAAIGAGAGAITGGLIGAASGPGAAATAVVGAFVGGVVTFGVCLVTVPAP